MGIDPVFSIALITTTKIITFVPPSNVVLAGRRKTTKKRAGFNALTLMSTVSVKIVIQIWSSTRSTISGAVFLTTRIHVRNAGVVIFVDAVILMISVVRKN